MLIHALYFVIISPCIYNFGIPSFVIVNSNAAVALQQFSLCVKFTAVYVNFH
jgi:hypothetical protein